MTVAARLAENPRLSIAVIEAGDFYEKVNGNLSIVPAYGGAVSTPAVDWGFNTTPQAALGGRQLAYNRGKTVGGSSATSLMIEEPRTPTLYGPKLRVIKVTLSTTCSRISKKKRQVYSTKRVHSGSQR